MVIAIFVFYVITLHLSSPVRVDLLTFTIRNVGLRPTTSQRPVPWPDSMLLKIQDEMQQRNISDTNLGFVLKEQLYFCPKIQLCHLIVQPNFQFTGKSCCEKCSCDKDCFSKGTCCPDAFLNLNTTNETTDACVRPQFRKFTMKGKNFEMSYYMKHKCSYNHTNEMVKHFCESIEDHPKTFDRFLSHVPVTSNVTGVTYRNKYCAICNGELEQHQIRWKAVVRCLEKEFIFPESLDFLLEYLLRHEECNIIFHPIIGKRPPEKCDWGEYTTCNQTGEMDFYDPLLEYGCNLYTSKYDTFYRNVHCYMCNNKAEPQIMGCDFNGQVTPFDVAAFDALLDFNVIAEQEGETNSKQSLASTKSNRNTCFLNTKYDSYRGICRQIKCAEGFIYTNNTCKRLYVEEFYKSYEVYLKLTNKQNCIPDTECVKNLIVWYLQSLFSSKFNNDLCRINLAVYYNSTESDNNDYTLVHIEMAYSRHHNVEEVIENILTLENETFIINQTPCHSNISIAFRAHIDGHNYGDGAEYGAINIEYFDPVTSEALQTTSYESFSAYRSCQVPLRLLRITRNMLCPRIVLDLNDDNFTIIGDNICFEEVDLCFEAEYVTNDRSKVYICADQYFARISNITEDDGYTYKRESCNTLTGINLKLTVITFICIILSIISLVVTLIIYCRFKELRTVPGKNNMLLALNLLIAQLLFLFGSGQTQIGVLCGIIGMFLHFSWMSALFMMNSCTIHMARVFVGLKRKVTLTSQGKNSNVFRYAFYSYSSAALFVLVNVVSRVVESGGKDFGYGGCICYISTKFMIGLTFALPTALIILANIICFFIVIIHIQMMPNIESSTRKDRNKFVIYIKLSCLTGLTWIFGFISEFIQDEVLSYLFVTLNAGQGIYIMLAFVCNKRIVRLLRGKENTKNAKCKSSNTYYNGSKNSVTSSVSNGSYDNTGCGTTPYASVSYAVQKSPFTSLENDSSDHPSTQIDDGCSVTHM